MHLSAFKNQCSRATPSASRPRVSRLRLSVVSMFTGIVQGVATVKEVSRKDNFSQIAIRFPEGRLQGIQIGASVAINGTCLTVTAIDDDSLNFDIMVRKWIRVRVYHRVTPPLAW